MRGRGDEVFPAMLLQIRLLTPYTKQPTHQSPTLAHQKKETEPTSLSLMHAAAAMGKSSYESLRDARIAQNKVGALLPDPVLNFSPPGCRISARRPLILGTPCGVHAVLEMLGVRTAKEELNAMTARAPPLYPQAVCHGPAPPLLAAQQVDAGREAHGAASHTTLRAGRRCRVTYPSTEMRGRGDAVLPVMLLQIRLLTPYTKQPAHQSPTLAHQKKKPNPLR